MNACQITATINASSLKIEWGGKKITQRTLLHSYNFYINVIYKFFSPEISRTQLMEHITHNKKKERQKREFRCTLKCINMSVWRKTNNVKNPTNLLARYRIESASLIFTSTIFQFQTYKYICRWKAIYVDLKSWCKMLEFPLKHPRER